MYNSPEVRELGTLSSFTLGSAATLGGGGLTPYTKGTVNAADAYTASSNKYGTPCVTTIGSFGTVPCS
jgi:hypothetical protein